MAIISVEVPENIAKKVNNKLISIEELYNIDSKYSDDIVDFGKKGIGKEDFINYLNIK